MTGILEGAASHLPLCAAPSTTPVDRDHGGRATRCAGVVNKVGEGTETASASAGVSRAVTQPSGTPALVASLPRFYVHETQGTFGRSILVLDRAYCHRVVHDETHGKIFRRRERADQLATSLNQKHSTGASRHSHGAERGMPQNGEV